MVIFYRPYRMNAHATLLSQRQVTLHVMVTLTLMLRAIITITVDVIILAADTVPHLLHLYL